MSRTLLFTSLLTLAAAVPAAAADVGGSWQIEGTIGQMPINVVCDLVEKDHKLTGNCHNSDFSDLKVTGEATDTTANWTYDVNYQGQQLTVSYNGKLKSATEMEGEIAVGGSPTGSFTAKKK